ncbi:hypothetical protein ACUXAV_000181 [Cupriavidus metallidurans]|jgi:hypothetical protein|uniref:hypothetical protein n=1 Tax=Cupriavidus TaxID=106589 RepID=UPI0004937F89|nr:MULTISPECIES: hypothetical protein [Cupriavidus]KWR74220.1 hypothetical protein RN01_30960 [Cupriavidus sp. SHE]KWW37903.1 hypothetical protein AU374_01682 [Cupriavidus metallidurans]MDE4918144.1 hypothetical protein [Cupriavidus metallidurans]QWC87693.1 hypothetical protein KB891_11620 [Cupriavidus metallidurans]
MTLSEIICLAIEPALRLLPPAMDTVKARVMLLAIGLQESAFAARRQAGNGPARGFWQFELGTPQSRGGVWGVFLHVASRPHLERLCLARRVAFQPEAIHRAIEVDDVLAAGVARLLLFTDPFALPSVTEQQAAWDLYARTWRPGKPHPKNWPANHARAVAEVQS